METVLTTYFLYVDVHTLRQRVETLSLSFLYNVSYVTFSPLNVSFHDFCMFPRPRPYLESVCCSAGVKPSQLLIAALPLLLGKRCSSCVCLTLSLRGCKVVSQWQIRGNLRSPVGISLQGSADSAQPQRPGTPVSRRLANFCSVLQVSGTRELVLIISLYLYMNGNFHQVCEQVCKRRQLNYKKRDLNEAFLSLTSWEPADILLDWQSEACSVLLLHVNNI